MAMEEHPRHPTVSSVVVLVLVAVVGLLLGLFGSTFGPLYPAGVGFVVAVVGAIVAVRVAPWGWVLVALGAAVMVGAGLYVALGVYGPP
jgi:hypothetical protein